ncbi:MAG: alpha/beta hydrolase [Clostridia bacterium]|nr:alpha/beta hydrolase [Clostridia bacterium]
MKKAYTIEKRRIPSGDYQMKLLILRPAARKKPREQTPGILWIHGGGYVTGMAGMIYFSRAIALVKKYGAVVITPEYRLAGKAPYPAALQDCYAALSYLYDHAAELSINPRQLMIGGESAGGGLTAALCMYARDQGKIPIAFQMPLYPMLDDRDTPSSSRNHRLPWNTFFNHAAWKKYLANIKGAPPPYAAPARQQDYAALPPAYTFVGSKEPFYCETLAYTENLQKAGVPAHCHVYPTGFHAFDMLLPFRKISRQAIAAFERQYLYASAHYFAGPEAESSCIPPDNPIE